VNKSAVFGILALRVHILHPLRPYELLCKSVILYRYATYFINVA